jgi:hypothetical protein
VQGRNTVKKFVDKRNAVTYILQHSSTTSQNETLADRIEKREQLERTWAEQASSAAEAEVEVEGEDFEFSDDETDGATTAAAPSEVGSSRPKPARLASDIINLGLPDDGELQRGRRPRYKLAAHGRDFVASACFPGAIALHLQDTTTRCICVTWATVWSSRPTPACWRGTGAVPGLALRLPHEGLVGLPRATASALLAVTVTDAPVPLRPLPRTYQPCPDAISPFGQGLPAQVRGDRVYGRRHEGGARATRGRRLGPGDRCAPVSAKSSKRPTPGLTPGLHTTCDPTPGRPRQHETWHAHAHRGKRDQRTRSGTTVLATASNIISLSRRCRSVGSHRGRATRSTRR